MSISDDIISQYSRFDESTRLNTGFGQIQFERTKELLQRHLGDEKKTILDIGGACGQYSFWLAAMGHMVHLVDIVPRHIEQASRTAEENRLSLGSMTVGDARELQFPDAIADALLLFGPMYHLVRYEDRLRVLREARRVVKPGGYIFIHAINRYSGIIYGTAKGFILDSQYMDMTRTEVTSGLRANAPSWLNTFSQAYFHHPHELQDEIQEAGLTCVDVLGIVGCAWQVPNLDEELKNADRKKMILDVARLVENEPAIGSDMLAICRR